MCVTVQSCDNKFEGQSCSSYVDDCMVAEVDASNDGESGMSTSVGRVVYRVCIGEASSGDAGAVADCGCACEAECATHTVVRDATK